MKKTAKIILIVCCAAFLLFLLLPFLETTSPQPAVRGETAKAEPQIFTSNPLTELVGRIARFFRTRQKAETRQQQNQPITAVQADEMFGNPQETPLYASAQSAGDAAETALFQSDGAAYTDAYLQNEEGEWVLIRQTAPEGSTRGMHEINAKDNAYDRYVAQERQARFTPVMRTRAKQEVPDSRLARVFNPIKRFFGLGEESVQTGALTASTSDRLASAKSASSTGLDKNTEKTSALPKVRPVDWEGFQNNPFAALTPGGTEATKELADMVFPNAALESAAEMLANIKFPNAENDPREKQEKENFKLQWLKEKYQTVNEKSAEILEEKAATQQENTLAQILKGSCLNETPSVKTSACSVPTEQDESQNRQAVQEAKNLNKRLFYEKTNLNLPPAGIVVVLHKTDQEIPTAEDIAADFQEDPDTPVELPAEKYQAVAMYHYMQEKCPDCYWVATGKGPAQELQQTVEAAGLSMKGDPLNRHQQYIDGFIEMQKQNGLEGEELNALKTLLEKNPTPYTAYTKEDLKQLHAQTFDLMLERAQPQDASVPFFVQPKSAYDYYNETGRRHPMFYGEGNTTGEGTLQERSRTLTNEVADFINSWKPIIQEVKQEAAKEGVTELGGPKFQKVLQEYMQRKKDFDTGNELGKIQK